MGGPCSFLKEGVLYRHVTGGVVEARRNLPPTRGGLRPITQRPTLCWELLILKTNGRLSLTT